MAGRAVERLLAMDQSSRAVSMEPPLHVEDLAGLHGMGRSPAFIDLHASCKDAIRMAWMKSRSRMPALVGIGIFLSLLPGCQSPGGVQGWWPHRQPPDNPSYSAARPTYSDPRTKPLYLSNYAGDDFSPTRPRRMRTGSVAPIAADSPPSLTVSQGSWDSE